MRGIRVPIEDGADPWLKLKDIGRGAYYGPVHGFSGDKPAVFFIAPAGDEGGLRHVCSPPHVFTEGPNGLTIRESIGCPAREGGGYSWHGFLTDGDWTVA